MEPRVEGSPVSISWRGDGEYFAVYSVDKCDGIPRVRVYNSDVELQSVGRTVGDGPSAVLRGLQPAMAYACNGGLIAVAQQRVAKKLHV